MNEHFWHTAMIELHVYSSFSIRKNLSIDILDQTDCLYFNLSKKIFHFLLLFTYFYPWYDSANVHSYYKKKNRKNEEKKIFSSQKREIDRVDYL